MAGRAKFRVGQVVCITCDFYGHGGVRYHQRFQMIMHIEPWGEKSFPGDCLTFHNGDRAHSKWVRPLTVSEIGRRGSKRRKDGL
jgi:hypothetical protein